ncbi:spore coat protein [Amedibacillus sp. YH-ame6]
MSTSSQSYSEKDISTNLLVTLKHMKAEMNTFSQEASNAALYKEAEKLYQTVSQLQRDVFEMMCGQSWYKMTADSAKNISKAYTKASNSEADLA